MPILIVASPNRSAYRALALMARIAGAAGEHANHPGRQVGFKITQNVLGPQRINLQSASEGLACRSPIAVAQSTQANVAKDAAIGARSRRQQAIRTDPITLAQHSIESDARFGLAPTGLERIRIERKAPFHQAFGQITKGALFACAQPENHVFESVGAKFLEKPPQTSNATRRITTALGMIGHNCESISPSVGA